MNINERISADFLEIGDLLYRTGCLSTEFVGLFSMYRRISGSLLYRGPFKGHLRIEELLKML